MWVNICKNVVEMIIALTGEVIQNMNLFDEGTLSKINCNYIWHKETSCTLLGRQVFTYTPVIGKPLS